MFAPLSTTTRLALLALITMSLTGVAEGAFAQGKAPAPTAPAKSGNEKLDVSDLENKYWSAKDTDFNVVQSRLYSKAGRFALTLNTGMYVSQPWSDGATNGAQLSYFATERYGYGLVYSTTASKDSDATTRLKAQGGTPNHNKMKGYTGLVFNWVPFYAKMSVLNSSITYFDMSFSPGLGMLQYEQQLEEGGNMKSTPAVTLDITQHYFINKYVAIRVDYENRWFQEDIANYRISGRTTTSNLNRTDLLMLGVTLYY